GEACVYHDDYHAAKEVTRLLTGTCKNIAYIGVTPKDRAVGTERRKGFLEALLEAGLEEVIREQVHFRMEDGYLAMNLILKEKPQVDGVFCATDHIAIGALQCLKEKKKKIRIVGMGDSATATIVEPALSSVHFYYRESGKEAARVLLEMIENQVKMKKEIKMGYEIVERDSTKEW
ncbi:MAG: trehalose repressor, partial [Lachnospiraceae bacterium]|nr:trehalose repressor [Lachnospiraceae bacterium]